MDRETIERFIVRILALVEHCNDPTVQVGLRQIAADLDNQRGQASADVRPASDSYMRI